MSSQEQMKQNISRQFEAQGIQINTFQALPNINAALDNIVGHQFDREVSEQIYEQCNNLDDYGNVLVNQFIDVLIQAELILQKKYQAAMQSTDEYQEKYNQCMAQLNEARRQQINQHGISEDSILNIECLQARGLRTNQPVSAIFILGQQRNQLVPTSTLNASNPQWNQSLQLQVITGKEQLQIELRTQTNQLLGTFQIYLEELSHQQKSQTWVKLSDQNYQENGEMELSLQYIHNKALYYEDLIRKIEDLKEQLMVDLEDYDRDLRTIQEIQGKRKEQSYLKPLNIGGPSQDYQKSYSPQNQHDYQINQSQQQNQAQGYQSIQKMKQSSLHTNQDGSVEITENLKYFFICGALIILFSLIESLVKPSQTDFILGSMIILIFWIDCFEINFIKKVGAFTLFTIILDFFWYKIYVSGWWNTKNYVGESSSLVGLYRIAVVFCFITLFIKIAMAYFLYQVHQEMEQSPHTKYRLELNDEVFIFGKEKRNPIFNAYVADQEKQQQIQAGLNPSGINNSQSGGNNIYTFDRRMN